METVVGGVLLDIRSLHHLYSVYVPVCVCVCGGGGARVISGLVNTKRQKQLTNRTDLWLRWLGLDHDNIAAVRCVVLRWIRLVLLRRRWPRGVSWRGVSWLDISWLWLVGHLVFVSGTSDDLSVQ